MPEPTPPAFPGPIDPPQLTVPEPPPEVGLGSPWAPADGENRDRILDWWRSWWRRVFFPWLAAFLAWLNAWLEAAEDYIKRHAISGYSWRTTATALNPTGLTTVTLTGVDQEYRPVVVGDLVSDQTSFERYGIVRSVVDETHASVETLGQLHGLPGYGWWITTTTIGASGTTTVELPTAADRVPQLHDLVLDTTALTRYGVITSIVDATHAVVTPLGILRGPQGPPGVAELGHFDVTTPSIPAAGVYQGEMAAQPQMVGAFTVSTDKPAWVRVYASEAYMLADADRGITIPLNIALDHGCYLDFVAVPSELYKALTPGVQLTDLGDGLWLSVVNTDPDDAQAVAVHFDYRTFRE